MPGEDNRMYEELRLLFSTLIADIRDLKSMQWKITNYVLLLDGALIGISKILHENSIFNCTIAIIIISSALILLIAGCYMIRSLQNSIEFRREKIDIIYNRSESKDTTNTQQINFTKEICDLIGKREPYKTNTNVKRMLYLVQTIGYLFVFFLVKAWLS